jgi:hypothetical protein
MGGTGFVKIKSISLTESYTGSIKIMFALRGSGGFLVQGQIYKNGTKWGTERAATSTTTFSEDFSGITLNKGDTIELYGQQQPAWQVFVSNFRLMFDYPATPTPTPTPTPPPPAGIFDFKGTPTGYPTATMDVSAISMKQSTADSHFEINSIKITNTSLWVIYIAMECKLFKGTPGYCPTSGEVFDGMDRVSTTRLARVKSLDPGVTSTYNLDFYQPTSILGTHTVCLYLHGSYDNDELDNEIAPITG